MKKNILMIEDDEDLAEILAEFLQNINYNVHITHDPFIGLSTLATKKFDLIILDLTLPGMDGLEVCQEIRKKYSTPMIISSARTDLSDKVMALDLGADDYMPKPYNPKELEARIKSIFRRASNNEAQNNDTKQEFVIDEKLMSIMYNDAELSLTKAEYEILAYFINKHDTAISREELIYNIQSISDDTSLKSVDVIISRIRHKLGESSKKPHHIRAIRGVGYKFVL